MDWAFPPARPGRNDGGDDFTIIGDDDGFIVIGIDFGTTYSGVAWATSDEFEHDKNGVNHITTWPGSGREEGKVPSELAYIDNEVVWGFEVPPQVEPARWFKLLLLRDEDQSDELRDSGILAQGRKFMMAHRKTAVDIIADYLRMLWKHTLDVITRSLSEFVINAMTFRVVITVPAIWKGYARQAMRDAAQRAGILDDRPAGSTSLIFAPEPEAAALATLVEPGRKPKKDSIYIICDAGGGTVDLISYKINGVGPIALGEVAEGTGALCGGVFIDDAFADICKGRLGDRWHSLSKAGQRELLKGEWEIGIKPQFKASNSHKDFIVSIPAEAFARLGGVTTDTSRKPHIKNGRMHFPGTLIRQTFAASFAGIDKLVAGQIRAVTARGHKVTGIILVGGLGASPYLYEHLSSAHSKAGIVILQATGMKPRSAICRGAVFKGFLQDGSGGLHNAPVCVTSTISRTSIGMPYYEPFIEGKHLPEDKVWDSSEYVWDAGKQMRWYLTKGSNVSDQSPIRYSFYTLFSQPDPSGCLRTSLHECEDAEAPSRQTSAVRMLCILSCKLNLTDKDYVDYTNPVGKKFKKLHYEVEMVPSGASVDFTVFVNGKKQGSQNVNVRFQ